MAVSYTLKWCQEYSDIKAWLDTHAGKNWRMNRQWVGCVDDGAWEITVTIYDDEAGTEFLLRWS